MQLSINCQAEGHGHIPDRAGTDLPILMANIPSSTAPLLGRVHSQQPPAASMNTNPGSFQGHFWGSLHEL